ncbi:MAG: adenine phosphoribosyltransferase [Nitrospinae bacterium]|nr:adenine phosphoribosyltransferase [Nitrospinota bacterium]
MEGLKEKIRNIPNFPQKGILFKDITTLLSDRKAYNKAIDILKDRYIDMHIDLVVCIEARGFVIGGALAYGLNSGVTLIRKPGKLPYTTYKDSYELEYGRNEIEIHTDAIKPGQRVLIVDDLLATGGTVGAAIELVKRLDGEIVELAFLIELTFLNGRERLKDYNIYSLIQFGKEE